MTNNKKKKYYNNITIGILIFIIVISIGLGVILAISTWHGESSNEFNKYYGPPLDDAKYEIISNTIIAEGVGKVFIQVNSSWDGIVIEANYSSVCNCNINIISPSGITVTIFSFSLSEEEISNGITDTSSGQYVTLQPGAWSGEIYGEWTFQYTMNGGPSDVTISRVISFGTP
ncbi:MAG: hypothetical protein WC389_20630 [Lutibacter sp.]|jgi:hypothetical protein